VNIPYFIASRYLFSKKRHNVINLISYVSVVGVAVGTMALVIVLSVLNGMNGMIYSATDPFNADIKISPIEGKTFASDSVLYKKIKNLEGCVYFSEVIEENALVKYGTRQRPIVIKAVSSNYYKDRKNKISLFDGEFFFEDAGVDYIVPGRAVARDLGIGLSFITPIDFYFPKRGKADIHNPIKAFNISHAYPSAIFLFHESISGKYIYTSIPFAQKLLSLNGEVSYLEVDINDSYNLNEVKKTLQTIVGSDFKVSTSYEQNEILYKMMSMEKMAVFFILAFILLIASFNIVGSLTMLIIDKKEDINTLSYLGMQKKDIERVFWNQGWLISLFGCLVGVLLGVTVCYLQKTFEFIKLGGNGYRSFAYPVSVEFMDILLVTGTVLLIGYLAARYPVKYLIKRLS
jgi:lipoprotein-releasing system permease protein